MSQEDETPGQLADEAVAQQAPEPSPDEVLPILVPAAFFAKEEWPGPHVYLRASSVGLTWTLLLPKQTTRYVDHTMAQLWEEQHLDWKAQAMCDLANLTGGKIATNEFRRPNGELYAIAIMPPDGLGPSRLLLRDELSALFPAGYRVALPEMSCAFAISRDVSEAESRELEAVIQRCHREGARPLADGIFDPEELLPDESPAKPAPKKWTLKVLVRWKSFF